MCGISSARIAWADTTQRSRRPPIWSWARPQTQSAEQQADSPGFRWGLSQGCNSDVLHEAQSFAAGEYPHAVGRWISLINDADLRLTTVRMPMMMFVAARYDQRRRARGGAGQFRECRICGTFRNALPAPEERPQRGRHVHFAAETANSRMRSSYLAARRRRRSVAHRPGRVSAAKSAGPYRRATERHLCRRGAIKPPHRCSEVGENRRGSSEGGTERKSPPRLRRGRLPARRPAQLSLGSCTWELMRADLLPASPDCASCRPADRADVASSTGGLPPTLAQCSLA